MIYLDFETRSVIDLIKLGATRYATDRGTQALCLCWAFDQDEEIHLWHRDHPWIEKSPRPDELIERIRSGEIVEAHNAFFEYVIWNYVLTREFSEFDVKLDREQMRCSAAKGSCLSLPRALGEAVKAVNLPEKKLEDGRRLINKLSKPRTRIVRTVDEEMLNLGCTKAEATTIERVTEWCEEEVEHRANWKYCAQDVRAERSYSNFLPEMTERELEYWKMDWRMNERGILLDKNGALQAIKLCEVETIRLNEEMQQLTENAVDGGSKRKPFRAWVNMQIDELAKAGHDMPLLPDTTANTLSFALHGVPTKAGEVAKAAIKPTMDAKWAARGVRGKSIHRALEIAMEVNRTSNSKYKQMVASVCPDDRLHDIMLYNGADRPVSGDAEVLTRQGWQRIDEWQGGEIAQWAHQKYSVGEITFASATRAILPYDGDMVRMVGPNTELLCTVDHKIPLISCRDNLIDVAAGDVRESNWAIPLAGNYRGATELPERTRLIIMYQADGRTPETNKPLSLHFREPRKIDRCKALLQAASLAFEERVYSDGSTNIKIVEAPEWLRRSKEFGDWLLNHDPAVFIDELKHWDGCIDKRNITPGVSYSTCSKNNAEWAQTLAALAGTRASIAARNREPEKWNVNYRVHVHSSGARTWLKKKWTFAHEKFEGTVYCARTKTGYFLVRYKGTIQVTGNTGRWSGKGVQPHNFVRGWMANMPDVWADIMAVNGDISTGWGDRELITFIWGEPLPALAKACRGALIASPDMELYAADFKSIEAVKLAWMAGCESQLALFRSKGDPYLAMACAIYKREITKADKDERQLGKKAVLGLGYCHAADTLILTRRGWVRIDIVEDWDMLWDGQEWVRHRGLICNGEKYVTNLGDTFPTMDHPVWCGERFHRAEKVVADADLNRRVLEAGADSLPLQDMSSVPATASDVPWLDVTAKRRGIKSIWRIGAQVAQRVAMLARSARQRISDTPITKQQCPTPTFEKCGSIGSLRQSAGFRDRIIQSLKWIERTMILAMSRATFAARPGVSNASTRAGRKEKIYDLIDAGPRHRYMILTRDGPTLVHNSMGWEKFQTTVWLEEGVWLEDEFCQMVVNVYRKEMCPEMPILWRAVGEAAIAAVQNPGEEFYAGGDALGVGSISYFMSDDRNFLHCRLPSGRLLAYLYPEVHTKVMWAFHAMNEHGKPCVIRFPSNVGVPVHRARYNAEKLAEKQRKRLTNDAPENFLSPHLSFMGRNIVTKQWQRCGTHGGSLTENADQASSRDLLAEAMMRVDTDGRFALLLSIHDEVIAEAPIGTCSVEEFEALTSEVPKWAQGIPVAAEGWISSRLRK